MFMNVSVLPSQDLWALCFVDTAKRNEHYSFEYSDEWLKETKSLINLTPTFSFYSGRQFPSNNEFGVFADSCPDRWGRALINRRERIQADREKRKPRELHTSDYLLGVYDETRMGAFNISLWSCTTK